VLGQRQCKKGEHNKMLDIRYFQIYCKGCNCSPQLLVKYNVKFIDTILLANDGVLNLSHLHHVHILSDRAVISLRLIPAHHSVGQTLSEARRNKKIDEDVGCGVDDDQ